jgi:predicted transcriptional regulator
LIGPKGLLTALPANNPMAVWKNYRNDGGIWVSDITQRSGAACTPRLGKTGEFPYTNAMPWERHMNTTTIELQDDLAAPLQGLADKLHSNKSNLVNQAVKEFLAREQIEAARWNDTVPALNAIRAGQGVGETEVHAWLASWCVK